MARGRSVVCAACRVQRKKCSEDCVLAPHFPADDPDKFAVVQKVYGTNHVIKLLQPFLSVSERHYLFSVKFALLSYNFMVQSCDTCSVVQKGVETEQRAEAASSLVREANARVKDPINGSFSVVHDLQKRIKDLESQLASKREEVTQMRSEYDKLVFLLFAGSPDVQDVYHNDLADEILYEDRDPLLLWEPMNV